MVQVLVLISIFLIPIGILNNIFEKLERDYYRGDLYHLTINPNIKTDNDNKYYQHRDSNREEIHHLGFQNFYGYTIYLAEKNLKQIEKIYVVGSEDNPLYLAKLANFGVLPIHGNHALNRLQILEKMIVANDPNLIVKDSKYKDAHGFLIALDNMFSYKVINYRIVAGLLSFFVFSSIALGITLVWAQELRVTAWLKNFVFLKKKQIMFFAMNKSFSVIKRDNKDV